MTKQITKKLIDEIISRIKTSYETDEIILFGSYAHGNADENSDIDLLVILNDQGICKTHCEKVKKRMSLSKLFRDIKKEIPMDILVYSKDEWNIIKKSNTVFSQEIYKTGIRIA